MFDVLLVDDEAPLIDSLLSFNWDKWDCRVVGTASNGEDALKKCEFLLPDIVVTDIAMPLLDGISFMRHVNETHPGIQFILLTVHKSFDYAQQAVRSGAVDYLIKDMNIHQTLGPAIDKARRALSAANSAPSSAETIPVLRLDASAGEAVSRALLQPFLGDGPGALAGVRVTPGAASAHALLEVVEPFFAGLRGARLILRGADELEALFPAQFAPRLAELAARFHGARVDVAYEPCAGEWTAYEAARIRIARTLDESFYEERACVARAREGAPVDVGQARLSGWLMRLRTLGTDTDAIETFMMEEIFASARRERIAPARLKEALLRILHAYEMRYAERALTDARQNISDARDIGELARAFVSGVRELLPGGEAYSYIVARALRYMSDHFSERDMQLCAVAADACVSPAYLSRKLKEETGKSFQELLMQLRMESAAKLLRLTGEKVYLVAENVGYANYRSFVNAFVHYYGVSPQKFR